VEERLALLAARGAHTLGRAAEQLAIDERRRGLEIGGQGGHDRAGAIARELGADVITRQCT
jgi:hypothetical protein